MRRPSLLRFLPVKRFELVARAPAGVVRERLGATICARPSPGNVTAPLSGSLDGDSFELRLRRLSANSGRAFLVGRLEDRGASTAAVGRVCVGSLPATLFLAVVGLAIVLRSGVALFVASWGLAILVFGYAKTTRETLRALGDLMSGEPHSAKSHPRRPDD